MAIFRCLLKKFTENILAFQRAKVCIPMLIVIIIRRMKQGSSDFYCN